MRRTLILFFLVLAMPLHTAMAAERWEALPPTPAPVAGLQTGHAELNGIRLFYAEIGQGSPVVVLHGGLANSDYLGNQVLALAGHHRVVVVDSRGHGRSTRNDQPFGYDLMTDDVVALLDRLKIQKADIVGWSDGAIIGLDMAMRHPDRVGRIFAFGANTQTSGLKDGFDKIPCLPPIWSAHVRNMRAFHRRPINTMPFRNRSARCGRTSRTGRMRNSAPSGRPSWSWMATMMKASSASTRNISPQQFPAPAC